MDFANKRIGGAVFTHGLALEEKLAIEFTDFVRIVLLMIWLSD